MVYEKKMRVTNRTLNGAPQKPQVLRSLSHLAHNVIELSELQVQLLKTDGDRAVERVKSSIVFAGVSVALLLSSLPVLLLAAAEALIVYAEWNRPLSFLVAAMTSLFACALCAAVGWQKFKQSYGSFSRSSDEFSRNVAWLKSELRGGAASGGGENV